MIKYNNSNINDWYYDTSDIIKVYRNGAVVYYKVISSGTTPTYQVCYAVVDDISQYSETEFEDVFNKADDKWYKLNNLGLYEQYGLYGDSIASSATTYQGKLSVYDGYEYIYSGSSWTNVGEVSGSSRVPQGYTEVEYLENPNNSFAYINTNFKPNQDTRIVCDMQCVTSSQYGRYIGAGAYNAKNAIQFDYESYYNGTLHISWGHLSSWTTYSNCVGDYNRHIYDWDKNYFYRDKGESNQFSASTTYTSFQCTDNLGIFAHIQNGSVNSDTKEHLYGRMYSFQIYDDGTLVRDLVPCKRNSDSLYGAYDIVNDVFYYPPNYTSYPMTGGSATTQVEYPLYYDEIQDPPNNLSFSSMTEAEEYQCPWVGMKAIIDGDKYIFSGDSTSGYEWVEIISPIPSEYQELEYFTVPRVSRTTTSSNLFSVPVDLQVNYKYVFDFTPVDFWQTSYYGVMLGGNDADTNFNDLGLFKLDNGWGDARFMASLLNYTLGKTKFSLYPYIIENARTVISMHMNGYAANNGATISIESNGVEVFTGSSTTKASSSYNPTIGIRNIPLLDMGTSGNNTYTANLKFHNFAVKTSSDILIYDYRPVERLSDGQVGVFDTVNQIFYPLQGYTVTKGEPV